MIKGKKRFAIDEFKGYIESQLLREDINRVQRDVLNDVLKTIVSVQPKKTFDIETFKNYINKELLNKKLSSEQREIFCSLLEKVLLSTKNYNGFQYIHWTKSGFKKWLADGKPDRPINTDSSIDYDNKYVYGIYGKFGRIYS